VKLGQLGLKIVGKGLLLSGSFVLYNIISGINVSFRFEIRHDVIRV
jgi:hypothetical protein